MKLADRLPVLKRSASKVRTVFLGKGRPVAAYDEPLDIILSPAYYWFRSEALPAKRAATAKKLAPAFFDPILPEGEAYEYMAVKADEGLYWLFAYRPSQIADALSAAGIKAAQVRGVYFAQTECGGLEAPLAVGESDVLVAGEGCVSLVHRRYADAGEDVDAFFSRRPRSRHRVPVNLFRSTFIDRRQAFRISAVALLFSLLFAIDYIRLSRECGHLEAEESAIRDRYGLPQTSFELKSMMRALEGRAGRQTRMREVMKSLDALPLQEPERIEALALGPKTLSLTFSGLEKSRADTLKKALGKLGSVAPLKQKGERWYAEVRFE